ncbi:hypothetical protein ACQPZQ_02430 [Pseudonocardia sp. CA-142604]|uniref:hypothetical protein n=1 Tax=Pseudonocardia sp. CA-142604 TaxID=3240024 RepID=UPI003D9388E6
MGKSKASGKQPERKHAGLLAAPPLLVNYDLQTPKFCLRHLQPGFDIAELDAAGKASFAEALFKRARMNWSEITTAPKHGLGSEFIPAGRIKPSIPEAFQDADRFLVLRYDGKLPMAGIRALDVLHILWIERTFNTLYDHGS